MAAGKQTRGTGWILEENYGTYRTGYSVVIEEQQRAGVGTVVRWYGSIFPADIEFSLGARLGKTVRLVLEDGREGDITVDDFNGQFTGTGPLLMREQ
jgi:hypothetical protein